MQQATSDDVGLSLSNLAMFIFFVGYVFSIVERLTLMMCELTAWTVYRLCCLPRLRVQAHLHANGGFQVVVAPPMNLRMDLPMDPLWTHYGPTMVPLWTHYEPTMNPYWVCGPHRRTSSGGGACAKAPVVPGPVQAQLLHVHTFPDAMQRPDPFAPRAHQ